MKASKNGEHGIRTIFLPFQPIGSVTTRQHVIQAITQQQTIIVLQTLPKPAKHMLWVFLLWLDVMKSSIRSPVLDHIHTVFRPIVPLLHLILRPSITCYTHDQLLSLITTIPGADTYEWDIHMSHQHTGMYFYYYQGTPKPLIPQPNISQPTLMPVPETTVPVTCDPTPIIKVTPPPIITPRPCRSSLTHRMSPSKLRTPRIIIHESIPRVADMDISNRVTQALNITVSSSLPTSPKYRRKTFHSYTTPSTPAINHSTIATRAGQPPRRPSYPPCASPSGCATTITSSPSLSLSVASLSPPLLSLCSSPSLSPSPSFVTLSRHTSSSTPIVKQPARPPVMRRSISLPPPPEPKTDTPSSNSCSASPIVPLRECMLLSPPSPQHPRHQRHLEIQEFQEFSQMLHSQWLLTATPKPPQKSHLCTVQQ